MNKLASNKMASTYLYLYFTLLLWVDNCVCPPRSYVKNTKSSNRLSDQEFNLLMEEEQQQKQKLNQEPSNGNTLDDLGIEYNRYLREVVETLEKDEDFRKKLERTNEADIRTGKIADELDYVKHHVRSKLDELKRQELNRLRNMAKRAYNDFQNEPGHIDHQNPHSFEKNDLVKLIKQVAQDLAEADEKRKQIFKDYEMQKHFERDQKLKQMNDIEREKFLLKEKESDIQKEVKHKTNPIHHPGSKKQLEEVWEKQDEMEGEAFNPKAFFALHDIDGNHFWDEEEVKTLFLRELNKLYEQGMNNVDLMEKAEEMERMREHVFNEMDSNKDRLISWDEFKRMSEQPNFEKDEGWKTIDQNEIYTNEELKKFEQQQIDQMIQSGHEVLNSSLNQGYQINSNSHQSQYMNHQSQQYLKPHPALQYNNIPQQQINHPPQEQMQNHYVNQQEKQDSKQQNSPVLQYAPQQQQYQASDQLKNHNTRLNDVGSSNIGKKSKENFGKSGHVAGN
ncbi:nucleobindin-2-like isoform X2 [Daktulosphaira vitifoliae]|uniref:nucleobindin-2-like isoform X2 n=1 Tax=Daktulosphaira vitifoliae TaxID=58002 RepID=UPI0021A9C2C7|nr:nucleobindin-2-like isoform X2 [Daktulosphaira vitifoliae]